MFSTKPVTYITDSQELIQPDDQSKHKFRDQVLKTRSNTWIDMKKFYYFFLGLIFFLQGRVSQVTEVYTTVDPRENSGYIVNGGSAKVGDRKEIVSIQFDGQGSIERKKDCQLMIVHFTWNWFKVLQYKFNYRTLVKVSINVGELLLETNGFWVLLTVSNSKL